MTNPVKNKIGLKWWHDYYKDCKLRHKIEHLRWELKYAFRRAWYGYDDVDIFAYDYRFRERTIAILQ